MNPINEWEAQLCLIAKNWPEQIVDDYMPYAHAWRNQYPGESPRTRERHIRLFKEWSMLANGKNLTPTLVMEWNEHLRKTARNGSTMARANGTLRAFLGWLKGVGVIIMDPSLALAKFPACPSKPTAIFTHAEYEKIVAYGEEHPEDFALATWLVVLAYHTGMSMIDCCKLRWDEVMIDPSGPCYIQHYRLKMSHRGGTKAKCIIPIVVGGELWNWIMRMAKAYRGKSDSVNPEAITFYENRRLEPKRIFHRLFSRALGSRNRKGRTFRCLRNTFCSRLLNAGVDPVLVSKMTGHSRLDQLAVYVTPDVRVMQEAIQRGLKFVNTTDEVLTIPLPALTGDQTSQ